VSASLSKQQIDELVRGQCYDPFAVLGPHVADGGVVVRVLWPSARTVRLVQAGSGRSPAEMKRLHVDGLFEALLADTKDIPAYQVSVTESDGRTVEAHDPYAIGSLLSDYDLHLMGEGNHYHLHEKLGAHVCSVGELTGTHFAVWAPNARRVSVVGDFNRWDGRRHAMRLHPGVGVWDIFVPGLRQGEAYKYEILPNGGGPPLLKADPFAFYSEHRPKTASIVYKLDGYAWGDADWMTRRAETDWLASPVSIYEVHLGSWRRSPEDPDKPLDYRELARQLAEYCNWIGYTHVEMLPLAEHPLDQSWGYQPIGNFSVTSRYGEPKDFMYLVDHLHRHGIGVILDWVPAHFPRDGHGLARFDGTHLYEHQDPRRGEHQDWGTLIYNYGRNEVRNYLLSNALFWLEEFHIDGLRVDAVASMLYLDYSRDEGQWVPNRYGGNENLEAVDFIRRFNELAHQRCPGVLTIAEESTAWTGVSKPTYLGGLGFGLKWNMGWMNDTLSYMHQEPIHRKFHHSKLTFSLVYCFSENFIGVLSHDEVVHGKGALLDKMPGDYWQRFANLRLLYGYMWGHPGKKLLFMGGEFGQWNEWNHEKSLDWNLTNFPAHAGMQQWMRALNELYAREPAMHQVDFSYQGFEWLELHDADSSVLAWLRRAADPDDYLVFVCNFTPVPRHGYRFGVPREGMYREVLNSDSAHYGGSNTGNAGGVPAEPHPWGGQPYSVSLTLPPLATLVLKPE